jgi:hypothetical protein
MEDTLEAIKEKVENIKMPTKTEIVKFAKEMGYEKKPKDLSASQKVIRTALISFAIMAILIWSDWLVENTLGDVWIGTWESFVVQLKMTGIIFTQVVLAKVRQYFEETKTEILK